MKLYWVRWFSGRTRRDHLVGLRDYAAGEMTAAEAFEIAREGISELNGAPAAHITIPDGREYEIHPSRTGWGARCVYRPSCAHMRG